MYNPSERLTSFPSFCFSFYFFWHEGKILRIVYFVKSLYFVKRKVSDMFNISMCFKTVIPLFIHKLILVLLALRLKVFFSLQVVLIAFVSEEDWRSFAHKVELYNFCFFVGRTM